MSIFKGTFLCWYAYYINIRVIERFCTQVSQKLNVDRFELFLAKISQNEHEEDCVTSQSYLVLIIHLKNLERHASSLFTRNIFLKVCIEISIEALLQITSVADQDS